MDAKRRDLLNILLAVGLSLVLSLGFLAGRYIREKESLQDRISQAFAECDEVAERKAEIAGTLRDEYLAGLKSRGDILRLALNGTALNSYAALPKNDPRKEYLTGRISSSMSTGDYLLVLRENGDPVLLLGKPMTGADTDPESFLAWIRKLMADDALPVEAVVTDMEDGDGNSFFLYVARQEAAGRRYLLVSAQDRMAFDSINRIMEIDSIGLTRNDSSFYMMAFSRLGDPDIEPVCIETNAPGIADNRAVYWTDCGLSPKAWRDGYTGTESLPEGSRRIHTRVLKNDVIVVAVETGAMDLQPIVFLRNFLLLCCSGLFAVLYGTFMREDRMKRGIAGDMRPMLRGRLILDNSIMKRLLPFAAFFLAVATCLTFYFATLTDISAAMRQADRRLEDLKEDVQARCYMSDTEEAIELEQDLSLARITARVLESEIREVMDESDTARIRYFYTQDENGQNTVLRKDRFGAPKKALIRNPWLERLAGIISEGNNGREVTVTLWDLDGTIIATSGDSWYGSLQDLGEAARDQMKSVLLRVSDYWVSEPEDPYFGNDLVIAVPAELTAASDRNGNVSWGYADGSELVGNREYFPSMVTVRVRGVWENAGGWRTIASLPLKNSENVDRCQYALLQNGQEAFRVIYQTEDMEEISENGINLTPEMLLSDYDGILNVHGSSIYVCLRGMNVDTQGEDGPELTLAAVFPSSTLYAGRLRETLLFFAADLLLMAVVCLRMIFISKNEAHVRRQERAGSGVWRILYRQRWEKTSAAGKMRVIFRIGCMLFLLAIPAMYLRDSLSKRPSVIRYIMEMRWDRGLNIFTVTTVLSLLCAMALVLRLIRGLMGLLYGSISSRAETCCRLAGSVVRTVIVVSTVIFSLYLFGVDTTSMLAGIGLLSTALAFGAKKVVEDVVSGIFMIIEGDFRVGDIVTVGNFTGRVMDIGVRTTKLIDLTGDVKILNNSSVTGVLNKSSETSVAVILLRLKAACPIAEVEKLIRGDLPRLKEKYTQITGKLTYRGVYEATGAYVIYRIEAECDELDRGSLQMLLDREMLELCRAAGFERA